MGALPLLINKVAEPPLFAASGVCVWVCVWVCVSVYVWVRVWDARFSALIWVPSRLPAVCTLEP